MKYYYGIVHKDAESAFGVTFPDLPGCFSAADTEEELLPNACDALDLWFEDAEEVAPMRLDQVKEQAAGDLNEGAFLIAVPRITRSTKVERVNVSLDRGMLDAIDKAAGERNLTRSAFLIEAARNEIEHRR